MSAIQNPHDRAHALPAADGRARATAGAVPPGLVLLLAAGAGLSVAPLYYLQPLLGDLAAELAAGDGRIGAVPMLTQLGYALGILLLSPLGDRHDRRQVILWKAAALVLALAAGALAPGLGGLLTACLVIGLAATLAQDIVPAAAVLADDRQRGRIVGTVMSGLLMGILLSRVVSGMVAAEFGWRAVLWMAAASVALLGAAAWRWLPDFAPTTALPYRRLLGSLSGLLLRHRGLRRAALAQGLLSIGFSAYWSNLAVMLHAEPFHLGSAAAGAFGLAGAAGALAAPWAGRLADRRGPAWVARWGCVLAAASFALMWGGSTLPTAAQLVLLVLGTVGFDLGVQASLIAHQTLVYALEPAARSRLNAMLFVAVFLGMAGGALLGSVVLAHLGWSGVMGMATGAALLARVVARSAR